MEPSEHYEQFHQDPVDVRSGLSLKSLKEMQVPSSSINMNTRPPDFSTLGGFKPVNYSIQTGEEFALEFMRERVLPKKPSAPNVSGDQNNVPVYKDLKGILGSPHLGSEGGSDVSVLTTGERVRAKDSDKKPTETENRGPYESTKSVPRASSGDGSSRGATYAYMSSGASDSSSTKMKFLCSFGGKILPRPSDGKLRYVGGETRIIRISKNICWQELMQKTTMIYNQPHLIKYQLPGEDLDALVTVSCDEDLQNMMEECTVLEGGEGSQKLRMFLFSVGDFDDPHFGLGSMDGDTDMQYVVAVNGMDSGLGRNSSGHDLTSTSGNDLDQLLTLSVGGDRVTLSTDMDPGGISAAPLDGNLTSPSAIISSQTAPMKSSNQSEMPVRFQDGIMRQVENEPHPLPVNSGAKVHVPPSMPSENQAEHAWFVETSVSMPRHEPPALRQGGMTEMLYHQSSAQPSETMLKEFKPKLEALNQQLEELEQIRSLKNELMVPRQKHDDHSLSSFPADDASFMTAAAETSSQSSSQHNEQNTELSEQGALQPDNYHIGKIHDANNEDRFFPSDGSLASGFSNHETEAPPPPPMRVYHSERIPREQRELLNRLSKSDDSMGSQFFLPHVHSGLQETITESVDPMHEGNRVLEAEHSISTAKPQCANPLIVADGRLQFEHHKELDDEMNQMKQKKPISGQEGDSSYFAHQPVPVGREILNYGNKQGPLGSVIIPMEQTAQGAVEVSNDERTSKMEKNRNLHETDVNKPGESYPVDSDKVRKAKVHCGGPSGNESLTQTLEKSSTAVQGEDPVSALPEVHWEEMPVKDTLDTDAMSHNPPFAWTETSSGAISHDDYSFHNPTQGQGDFYIDINDRFPPNLFSDIFLKARISEDHSNLGHLRKDDAGLSLNMENHEPQRWSFFRNLAHDEFGRKDVSLMDQDHIISPTLVPKFEEGPRAYHISPLKNEGVALGHVDSQIGFDEDIQQDLSRNNDVVASGLHSDYLPPRPVHPHLLDKSNEGKQMQVEISYSKGGEAPRMETSDYEVGKLEVGNIGLPIMDAPSGDFDIDLQIINNEDLEELKELGSGTFGTVYHGKWRGTDVAIKRIKKSCFNGRSSEQERLTTEFWREAEILSKLHHPNVVAFYGVVQDGPGSTLATVTEFMVNGSLRHVLLRKDRYLDRKKRLIIAMDAAFGMEYLHSKNIVHFDLKCDNLLVNLKDPHRPICKVGDFGLSKIKRNTLVSGGVRGTLPWMAPELLNGSSNKVSEKVDVFSFGIVMWEILTGEEPYANMHYGAIIGGIVNNTLRPPIPSLCDAEWRRLMEQCWAPDPVTRPSFTEIARRLRVMSVASQNKTSPKAG
ncbi:Serine/threonine-protein kinase CTR1 [Acorus calamus]|uniref:Serine/threonine-protein kinase CTR1 n=1 Tax=Acorus calamus TaxID=4465 RepID=A0AAV9FLH6_ACOCL|nr:Serine/threonine-protein kinase CTR1 [Acorus calamus]